MSELNFRRVTVGLVLTLVILFAGENLIQSYRVDRILIQDLTQIQGVKEVIVSKRDDNYSLEITLNGVINLKEVFFNIQNRVEETLDKGKYELEINSTLSKELEVIDAKVNLALHEALGTERFVDLGKRVNLYGIDYKLDKAEVKVDSKYIYLTLVKDDYQLYKVIERKENQRLGGGLNG